MIDNAQIKGALRDVGLVGGAVITMAGVGGLSPDTVTSIQHFVVAITANSDQLATSIGLLIAFASWAWAVITRRFKNRVASVGADGVKKDVEVSVGNSAPADVKKVALDNSAPGVVPK